MNSFCSFFYALCYKAVLLRRQMINDDLLGSYTVRGVHARASVERRSRERRERRASCLSRLAPSVTRVVICVSQAFCSKDQEKRETARCLSPKRFFF